MTSKRKLFLRYFAAFTFLYALFYVGSYFYKEVLIKNEISESIERLESSLEVVVHYDTLYAKSVHKFLQNNSQVLSIFSEAADCNQTRQAELRDTLHRMLYQPFAAMEMRGVSQLQFIFADKKSFLKLHEPKSFGDTVIFDTQTQEIQSGFYPHNNSFSFRNIFPLYNGENIFIGSLEITFLADTLEENLAKINQSSSYFLLHKDYLDKEILQKNADSLCIANIFHKQNITQKEKDIFAKHKDALQSSIQKEEKFGIFNEIENTVELMVFIPIKNATHSKTVSL
jgi:hypothetical protein